MRAIDCERRQRRRAAAQLIQMNANIMGAKMMMPIGSTAKPASREREAADRAVGVVLGEDVEDRSALIKDHQNMTALMKIQM